MGNGFLNIQHIKIHSPPSTVGCDFGGNVGPALFGITFKCGESTVAVEHRGVEPGNTLELTLEVSTGMRPGVLGSGTGGKDQCAFAMLTVESILTTTSAFSSCIEVDVVWVIEVASIKSQVIQCFSDVLESNYGGDYGGGKLALLLTHFRKSSGWVVEGVSKLDVSNDFLDLLISLSGGGNSWRHVVDGHRNILDPFMDGAS